MKKTILAITFSLVAAGASAAQVLEAIVIRVGDRIVTRTQYERRLRDAYAEAEQGGGATADASKRREEIRKNLPNEIINELLVKDRADRIGLVITDADIKDAVGRLKQQYGISTDEQFEDSLRKSGLTRAEMEARLRDTLITNKVFSRELRNREDLSDRELRERYDREKEHYRLPERAHLREIVIIRPETAAKLSEAQQKAKDVTAAAKQPGTDFSKLASTMSDSGTRDKGGDLGEVGRGELLPDLDKAVFAATAGSILGPIETKSGWHIIKVESRLPSEVPAFESVKDRLRRDASDETFQRDLKAYMESLRKDAFIQINEQNIPSG
ncbi:MAG TPA: peptidylprolyl isomerase [Thermoanaerobaculia bacterium]|nr:peptidylprolyl isomerase [Thermoanaerobaculia bacterium]